MSFWESFTCCFPWPGARRGSTPVVKFKGKVTSPRRVAWEQVRGPIPPGCDVVTTCGNSLCCNPNHLTLSSPKLSDDDVRAIRESSLPSRVLAAVHGINKRNVDRIRTRELRAGVEQWKKSNRFSALKSEPP
ncbi:hypothetical protein Pan44_35590 [Caulifigura coniformis]|uniref:HNH nuclease domain-containing protein n=1 Tax=Caulifigura coniformis TaxID=2527983 RepID=A0A517SHB9_9PLAN|nr:HNH endonuclease signature motif containing protein [Caulifigura coniformis]QDT55515.1 hypothetical protein Pan44_35590 [Caulifigura coniformis]